VNVQGRTANLNDLQHEHPRGATPFIYDLQGMAFTHVVVQRLGSYWCNSWGGWKARWGVKADTSMGISFTSQDRFCYNSGSFGYFWREETREACHTTGCWGWPAAGTACDDIEVLDVCPGTELCASGAACDACGSDGSTVLFRPRDGVPKTYLSVQNYDTFIQDWFYDNGCETSPHETVRYAVYVMPAGAP
jgi:hypothetical protein